MFAVITTTWSVLQLQDIYQHCVSPARNGEMIDDIQLEQGHRKPEENVAFYISNRTQYEGVNEKYSVNWIHCHQWLTDV